MTPEDWRIVAFTAGMAAMSTLSILPFGVALAWVLARFEWRGKSFVETLVSLPLVLPPVATGLILLKLLGRRGPLGAWLQDVARIDIVFTWKAVFVSLGVMSFPLLVRSARTAFEGVNPRLEQVARTLGAGEWRVFCTITAPLAMRGILGGLLLAFARALGEFGATIMVAGNIPEKTTTLSLAIYQSVQLGEDGHAYCLLGISVVLAFGAVWLSETLCRRSAR
ncbi:MAG: molybdate ABC transporter permease subunit [Verrucomicrobia bacterium]|nr:molybdate ABC transporter permease subunit [Verrucomicrobiota bacterium]MBI3869278.1 molybdate ABC transporter permease subunit [Verrucomicrobiota bacterium]